MRVVCAACDLHYADIDSDLPFEEILTYSDALAVYHMAQCQASRDEKDAAWELMEAVSAVETSG
jgi:hypothetical protein